jgi:hypothetical protein
VFAFASVIGSQEKFDRCARPGITRNAEPDAIVVELTEATSMCSAYNEVLDAVAGIDGLEGLVLLHEDTELLAPDACDRLRAAFAAGPPLTVAGVVGARGVTSLAWWEGEGVGEVTETRGHVAFGGTGEVDAVDGLLLALSPEVVRSVRFDEGFDAWHGYDADLCFDVRARGGRVVVVDLPVHHHTKGGFGDEAAFLRADARFRAKWFPAAAAAA